MSLPWIGRADPRSLSLADFEAVVARWGSDDPFAVQAVFEVEAGGEFFDDDGNVVGRFEPHKFPRAHWAVLRFDPQDPTLRARAALRRDVARHAASPKPLPAWVASIALPEPRRAEMFALAYAIDPEAAVRASSWGGPQIMGFNHDRAGFATAIEMVRHMAEGAPQQLGVFVQFVEGLGLESAIVSRDFLRFAEGYNGSGKPEVYAEQMEAAYRRLTGRASPKVLRSGARGAEVKKIQAFLGIEDDGVFGPGTDLAVREFQARAGLTVDGVVGAVTWKRMEEQGAARPSVQPTPRERTGKAITVGGAVVTGATVVTEALTTERVIDTLEDIKGAAETGGALIELLMGYGPGVLLGLALSAAAFGAWMWVQSRGARPT